MGYFKRAFDKDCVEVVKIVVFFWVCIISMMQSGVAMAHGGVSMEEDLCVMKLGTYRSHFTGYQPEKRSTQEFCEDIPEIGNVVLVMDFMSDELRSMKTDFRIIKDVKEVGISATYDDLGTKEDIENATVFYEAPKEYPHGTLNVSYKFDGPGDFIGLVTSTTEAGESHISVFPFSVGRQNNIGYLFGFLAAALVSYGLYRFSQR
jgi:hypothetical protein